MVDPEGQAQALVPGPGRRMASRLMVRLAGGRFRRRDGEELARMKELYATLTHANQAVLRSGSPGELFDRVCAIAAGFGRFDLAWIGLVEPEEDRVRPVAMDGPLKGYVEGLRVALDPRSPLSQGITGICAREGRPTVSNDWDETSSTAPWRRRAAAYGIRASAAVPVAPGGKVVAVLTLYSRRAGFFREERMALLEEVGRDLSFALETCALEQARRRQDLDWTRTLENRVEARTRELEGARREMEVFTSALAHDLRAPLRHLEGFSGILAQHLEAGRREEALRCLSVIQGASRQMHQLLEGLLRFANLAHDELHPEPLDLGRMVDEVIAEQACDTAGRKVQWDVGPLPGIQGDPVMMRVLLQNLLGNAVKYTRTRPEAHIRIRALGGLEGEVGFLVQDDGVGFDPARADRLFGVFQRLHARTEFEGIGMGLASVRRIVLRHGGRLWAIGDPDRGATFHVAFPAS